MQDYDPNNMSHEEDSCEEILFSFSLVKCSMCSTLMWIKTSITHDKYIKGTAAEVSGSRFYVAL